jgi:glutaredoxin 3
MPKVTMYSTRFCPYCIRARMLLENKGVEFTDIRVDSEPQRREEMETRAGGRSSVPQIFIDDEHVGGCDDLYELDFEGVLDKKLGLE